MIVNFTASISFLIVLLILIVDYLNKERLKNLENIFFKYLAFCSIAGLTLEALTYGLIEIGFTSNEWLIFIGRFVFLYYVVFMFLFVLYGYTSCFDVKDPTEKRFKILSIVEFVLYSIFGVLVLFLPYTFKRTSSYIYPVGMLTDFSYFVGAVGVFSILIFCVMNFKRMVSKKIIPLLASIILAVICLGIQSIYPDLLLLIPAHAIVIILLYFTIENPDLKLMRMYAQAKEEADKANHAKTDFLSSMSHEIRTPLNAIVGFSDCIMDAESLGEAKENAKDIVNASQTLLEIVNGILDISKIEAGKIEIVNSKYNAPETFMELAKLITPRMNEKGLDFTYTIAPDLPITLFGDHANIKKIVTNLLSNACKYTDKGFVHYEVNCINTHNVSKLIISVEDSGRGIKKDSVDKMFTRFQRLEEDRNTTIEGTGLGLAITKQLIELMGGRIILHTVYGQGSKFTVVLNQKITKADDVSVKKVKSTLDLTDVKIMLVDDTPLNLKVASKLLEKYNANHIVQCSSGFECLDRIKRGEVYDLILLDDMMPKMSGVQTLQQLKQIPGFKVPTVALTANAISGMREKYLSDGFDDFLAKPIEKDQMIQVINQLLGRSVTEDIRISQKDMTNVSVETPNIREDVVPNVVDISKNVEDKKARDALEEEEKNNPDIIPVEENIEEILGDQLDMNYKDKTMKLQPVVVNQNAKIESLEEPVLSVTPKEENTTTPVISNVQTIETVPVVDVAVTPVIEKVQPVDVPVIGKVEDVVTTPTVVNNTSNNSYDRSYLESNGVDVNHALELLGDMEMYNMTISDFMKDVEAKWERIVQYKNQNNMPDYAIEVHSLKSDCKYLGFMSLADISYEHELKSKENDSNFVNENFSRLETEYKKVLEIARCYVEHNPQE